MFCFNCGGQMPDNTKFCPSCGAACGQQSAQADDDSATVFANAYTGAAPQQPSAQPAEQPVNTAPAYQQYNTQPPVNPTPAFQPPVNPTPAYQQQAQPYHNPSPAYPNAIAQPQKKGAPVGIIVMIIVLVLAVGAVIALFATGVIGNNAEKMIEYAEDLVDDGEYDDAIAEYEKIIDKYELNPDGYIGLSEAYIESGNYQKAVQAVKNGIEALEDGDADDEDIEELEDELEDVYEDVVEDSNKTANYIKTQTTTFFTKMDTARFGIKHNGVETETVLFTVKDGKWKLESTPASTFGDGTEATWYGGSDLNRDYALFMADVLRNIEEASVAIVLTEQACYGAVVILGDSSAEALETVAAFNIDDFNYGVTDKFSGEYAGVMEDDTIIGTNPAIKKAE